MNLIIHWSFGFGDFSGTLFTCRNAEKECGMVPLRIKNMYSERLRNSNRIGYALMNIP